ncbi:unnamed protein product, partial [Effrenium voratum]
MARYALLALLGTALGELQSEVDVASAGLYVVEAPPPVVLQKEGRGLRLRGAELVPPSVGVLAAVYAILWQKGLIGHTLEEPVQVVEELHHHLRPAIPEEPEPETERPTLRWCTCLGLLAFIGAAWQRRCRRNKSEAAAAPQPAAVTKTNKPEMFRIATEQPDEEPEPARKAYERMMSEMSQVSDSPLEVQEQTEIFRMQTELATVSERKVPGLQPAETEDARSSMLR